LWWIRFRVWANDIDNDAALTYSKFIDDHIVVGDISTLINEIPKAELIIGGPPCQSFSLVGKRTDDDHRGKFVFSFLKIISKRRPLAFVMENVPGLCSSKIENERLHHYLLKQFIKLGYTTNLFLLNALDFYVPQNRKRLFLIGNRLNKNVQIMKGIDFVEKILKIKSAKLPVSCKDALNDLPIPTKDKNKIFLYNNRNEISSYALIMRQGCNQELCLHFIPTMSERDELFVKHIPPGGNYKNIPDEISTKRIMKFKSTGGRTTTYARLHPERPAYTINTYFNRPNVGANYHYSQDRLITPREGLRLQSFPDYFAPVYKSQRSLYRQIGNAVPPLMAYGIAESLKMTIF